MRYANGMSVSFHISITRPLPQAVLPGAPARYRRVLTPALGVQGYSSIQSWLSKCS